MTALEQRKAELIELLKPYLDKYGREMLNEFYYYWTEQNKKGTKLRIDGEKYFDLSRRLATWHKNQKSYGRKQVIAKDTSDESAIRAVIEINKSDSSAFTGKATSPDI